MFLNNADKQPLIHSNTTDVVVIGAAGIDTNVYLAGQDIDFTVEANFTENIDCVGQAGGYTARGFAQLGYNTGYIGYIGEDHTGQYLKEEFTKDNITTLFFTDPKGTKRSINLMNRDGTRKNFYDGKSHTTLHVEKDKCREFLANTKHVHFNLMDWSRNLLPITKELDLSISCDLQDIVDPEDPYRQDFIQYADIIFFSSTNFPDPVPLIRFYQDKNPDAIFVVGRGKKGAIIGYDDSIVFKPAISMEEKPVVDTNGAGDALAVGFLSSYLFEHNSIQDALLKGQIAARYKCSLKATSSNLITKRRLDQYFNSFIKSHSA